MVESTFSVEAMIRGYHVYKDIWNAVVNEELQCQREPFNSSDSFAVAVVRGGTIVGHVPRKISSVCSLFFLERMGLLCVKSQEVDAILEIYHKAVSKFHAL